MLLYKYLSIPAALSIPGNYNNWFTILSILITGFDKEPTRAAFSVACGHPKMRSCWALVSKRANQRVCFVLTFQGSLFDDLRRLALTRRRETPRPSGAGSENIRIAFMIHFCCN